MKIMVFCSNPVNGGTARIFYEFVTGLKNELSDEDIIYACINKGNDVEIYKKLQELNELPIISAEKAFAHLYGGTLVRRVVNGIIRNILYFPIKRKNLQIIKRFIIANDIDVVVIHNGGYYGDDLCNQVLTAAYQCKNYVMSRVYVLHNDMEKNIYDKVRYRYYDRKISKEATNITTVSEFTRNRIRKMSYITQNIEVVYNGLTVSSKLTREQKKERIKVDETKTNILMIGNFFECKGHCFFIKAALKLLDEDKRYRFTIIGNPYDNVYYDECMYLINDSKYKEYFSVYCNINNAEEYIELFDLLVVPSLEDESFGLTSVEAMAWKKPIAAFGCGGIPEVVQDGRNGYIVPVGDWELLAQKIHELIKDKEKYEVYGKQCKLDYEMRFSTKAMAKQYLDIILNQGTGIIK